MKQVLPYVDRFGGVAARPEGVHLTGLPPLTTLLVWTRNSLYRIVVTDGSAVYVQGGPFFPDPTSAHLDGATSCGGSMFHQGWIGVGLRMEIRSGLNRIVTSCVCAITKERSSSVVQ